MKKITYFNFVLTHTALEENDIYIIAKKKNKKKRKKNLRKKNVKWITSISKNKALKRQIPHLLITGLQTTGQINGFHYSGN